MNEVETILKTAKKQFIVLAISFGILALGSNYVFMATIDEKINRIDGKNEKQDERLNELTVLIFQNSK